MTNVIEGLSKRIDNVPAELLDDAIRTFVVIAERNGGKMMGGKYQLTAKVAKRYQRPGVCYAWMKGFPYGFWVWKETGTAAHVIKPKVRKRRRRRKKARRGSSAQAGMRRAPRRQTSGTPRVRSATRVPGPLGGDLRHYVWGPVMHPGTSGSLRWTKTCNQADVTIEAIVRRHLEKAVA